MILQNLDVMSEKNAENGVFVVTKCKGYVFYCRQTYIVWQSFEKIGAQTVEKVCLEKTQCKMVVPLLHRGRL